MPLLLRRARLLAGALALLAALFPCGVLALSGFREIAMALWCRLGLWALGVGVGVEGPPPPRGALVAANHISYVDILILGAFAPGVFVAKSEVARWPLVGFAARLAGALFIERTRPRAVAGALGTVGDALDSGSRVLLFPEGGIHSRRGEVTRFHTMFFDPAALRGHPVVPAAIRYLSPADPKVWAWTDDSTPVGHAFRNLAPGAPVRARLTFGPPLPGDGERKEFAAMVENSVRGMLGEFL